MEDDVKLCVDCKYFQQKTSMMDRLGFRSRAFCAAPNALRNSAFSVVRGESTHECEQMRASSFACGLSATWFVKKPGVVDASESSMRRALETIAAAGQ